MSQRAVLPPGNEPRCNLRWRCSARGRKWSGTSAGRTDGRRSTKEIRNVTPRIPFDYLCLRARKRMSRLERQRRKGDICASQEGLTRLSIPCRWAVTFHSSSEWRRFSPEHWNKFCHTKRAKINSRSAERKIALILLSRFRRRPASATSPKRGLHRRCRSGTHEEMDSGGGAVVLGCFAGK